MEPDALENLKKIEAETVEEQDAAIDGAVESEQEQAERQEQQDAAAQAGATMAVSFVETLVKMRWQFVKIEPEVKAQVIEKAVPVVKKYDAELPEWLKPYQEEIELGMVVAAAGFGVAMQVRIHNQEQAKAKAEKEQAENREPSGASPAPDRGQQGKHPEHSQEQHITNLPARVNVDAVYPGQS